MKTIRSRSAPRSAFSILETVVALGIGSMLFAILVLAFMFTCRGFTGMGNYMVLDNASSVALDKFTRDVREVRSLSSFATNQLVFVDLNSNRLTYAWSPQTHQLTRSLTGAGGYTNVLLQQCDFLAFHISQRSPLLDGTFGFYSATNTPSLCKLIDVSWRCSRTNYSVQLNTESVQTAKVVMRN